MNRKSWILLLALVGLGALYVCYFTDWFAKPRIQISVTSRPGFGTPEPGSALAVVFGFDQDYSVDRVRVVSLSSLQTNKAPVEVWSVGGKVKLAHSTPLRGFAYGGNIEGLSGGPAQPLVPGLPYRLEMLAGKMEGSVEFIPRPAGE